MRDDEMDWCLQVHDDPAGRRGLWTREHPPATERFHARTLLARLEICAGREGDDEYVDLRVGNVLSSETLEKLLGCLAHASGVEVRYWHNATPAERERCEWDDAGRYVRCTERCEKGHL